MPLTKKGKKIMRSMKEQYGDKEGEAVFYASRNKGVISGVEKGMKSKRKMQMGGVVNPIQPMYNPTQADQQRQRNMMEMRKDEPLTATEKPQANKKPMMGMAEGGALKDVPEGNKGKGLSKLPTEVRNKMGFKQRGGLISNGKQDYRKSGMFYSKGAK